MNKYIILILIFTMTSCSSMKKTIIYSSLAGGIAGSVSGAVLSPDKESQGGNAAIFGLIGAGIAGLAGYALYKDDPRNYKLDNMLLDDGKKKVDLDPNLVPIGLENLTIGAELNKNEAYEVPLKKLPKELQGKVNKQFLIKYQSKERYIKKGNKTYYVPAFDIYEHGYSNTPDAMTGGNDGN